VKGNRKVTLRRAMLVLTIVVLVAGSGAVGIVAADWPFWQRIFALARLDDGGEWPDSFYTPVARIDGRGSGAFFPVAAAGELTIEPQALEAAAAWAGENNSVALLVLHRGRVQLERYWQGMTPDAFFSGRAMSRSLVGLVYGHAIADGRVSLDDRADRHLEEWRNDPRGAITVRELLQNVSGLEELPANAVQVAPDASALQRAIAFGSAAFTRNARLALGTDFGAAALSLELQHPPGSRFAFSNANAQILGVILERATGEDFERYFERKLWQPLGAGAGEFYMDRERGMPAVYCCFRATPRDFLRLGSLLATDGLADGRRALPEGWVAELATTSAVNPLYGLQIWSGRARAGLREYIPGSGAGLRHGEDYVADDVIWMEGGGGRSIWAIPSRQLVIVRLGRASPRWDPSVLPNTLLRGVRAGG
jgi:CubicO group peptidase (beta-lactamase class C family)